MESKAQFVSMLSSALQECGKGRYDSIMPLTYDRDSNGNEWVYYGRKWPDKHHRINVTADSLLAIMKDVARGLE